MLMAMHTSSHPGFLAPHVDSRSGSFPRFHDFISAHAYLPSLSISQPTLIVNQHPPACLSHLFPRPSSPDSSQYPTTQPFCSTGPLSRSLSSYSILFAHFRPLSFAPFPFLLLSLVLTFHPSLPASTSSFSPHHQRRPITPSSPSPRTHPSEYLSALFLSPKHFISSSHDLSSSTPSHMTIRSSHP